MQLLSDSISSDPFSAAGFALWDARMPIDYPCLISRLRRKHPSRTSRDNHGGMTSITWVQSRLWRVLSSSTWVQHFPSLLRFIVIIGYWQGMLFVMVRCLWDNESTRYSHYAVMRIKITNGLSKCDFGSTEFAFEGGIWVNIIPSVNATLDIDGCSSCFSLDAPSPSWLSNAPETQSSESITFISQISIDPSVMIPNYWGAME